MKINRIIVLSLLSVTQIFALTIYDLKDTYNILKDEYRHLSPVNGAVWWQTKAIQNLYDYGNYELDGAIAESGDTDPKDLKIFKQTKTVKLLNEKLFHRFQGSFNITMSKQNIASDFTAKTLGTILGFMEKFRADHISPSQSEASSSKSTAENASPHKAKPAASKGKKEQPIDLFKSKLKKILKAEFPAKTDPMGKFVNALADCLNESGYFVFNKDARQTVPAAPYGFLLGFLYQKSQSRAEIAQFFAAIETTLGNPITTHDYTSDAWAADTYDAQTIAALKNKNFETMPVQDLIKEYESLAVILLSDVPNLPPPVEYASVSFEGQHFADCVETTIRNLCNIILYDNGTFNAAKIGAAAADITTYYQKNNELLTAGTTGAHSEWIPVIENQAWVTYNRLVSADHTLVLIADKQPVEHVQGFIHINSSKGLAELSQLFNGAQIEAITLGGHDFTLLKLPHRSFIIVNPAQYKLYEVQPTLRNIIIALNKFLGLNLIPDMPKAFIDHTFNQTHFAALAQKLQWNFSGTKEKDLDTFDYKQEINLKISVGWNGTFDIYLSSEHGEISPDITKKDALALGDLEKNIVSTMNTYADYMFLPNIIALICKSNIAKLIDDHLFWIGWYVQDLATINGKLAIAEKILKDPQLISFEGLAFKMLATLPIMEDLLPQKQALELIMPLNKFKYLENHILKIGEKNKKFIFNIYEHLTRNGYRLDEATTILSDGILDKDWGIRGPSSSILSHLAQKNINIKTVLDIVKKGTSSEDDEIKKNAKDIFFEFATENNTDFKEAINIAIETMKNDKFAIDAVKLLANNINDNMDPAIINKAIEYATLMQSNNPDKNPGRADWWMTAGIRRLKKLSCDVLLNILKKEKSVNKPEIKNIIVKKIINSTTKLLSVDDYDCNDCARQLFELLLKQNQGFKEAQEALPDIKNENIAAKLKEALEEYQQRNKQ